MRAKMGVLRHRLGRCGLRILTRMKQVHSIQTKALIAVAIVCAVAAVAYVATQPPRPVSVGHAISILGRSDLEHYEKDPARAYLRRRLEDPSVVQAVASACRRGPVEAQGEMMMLLQLTENARTTDALIGLLGSDRWSGAAGYALALRGSAAGRIELERAIEVAGAEGRYIEAKEMGRALSLIQPPNAVP